MPGKKSFLTLKRPQAVTQAVTDELRLDPMVDNVSRLLQNYGFRQVVLPASETGITGVHKLYGQVAADRMFPIAKWFYIQPVAPWEERAPMRHEFGIFLLGDDSSMAYAQLLTTVNHLLLSLGITGFATAVTSRGCVNCQKNYREALGESLGVVLNRFCQNCEANLEKNLPAVFACQRKECQAVLSGAPQMIDFLDESCRNSLVETLEIIDELEIPYVLNPVVTRGIAAEKIVFDFGLPATSQLGWGGSLAHLAAGRGAGAAPAIGFLTSLEELSGFLPTERRTQTVGRTEVFIISLGSAAGRRALALFRDIHGAGIAVREGLLGNQGIRGQLKEAQEHKAEIALIIGQKEAMDETVILRDVRSGMQEVFVLDRIVEEVRKRLAR